MKKIFWLVCLIPLFLFAQQKQSIVLNMDDAIRLAIEKNAELKIASMDIQKAEEKLREARSGLFPQLNASGQYQRYIDLPVIFMPKGSPFGPTLKIGADNSYSASLSLTLPLFSYPLYEGISLASEALDITKESYKSVKNKVVTDVKKAFLAVLLTRETKDVMAQSLKNAEDNFENIKKLRQGGTLSDYDVLRAEVQVENLKPTVLQMENNYKLSLEALKVAIGLDASQEIDVVGDMVFNEPYILPDEKSVIEEMLRNNPQLGILEKQVTINDKTISLEKSAHLPTLAAFGTYQYQA